MGRGWFEDAESVFFAMEWVESGDLGRYMEAHKTKARVEAAEIMAQVLEGLAALHERGIWHRNLKPQVWSRSAG